MTQGLYWGFPVIFYLFLAGLGAGAVTVSASMQLRGGGNGVGTHDEIGSQLRHGVDVPLGQLGMQQVQADCGVAADGHGVAPAGEHPVKPVTK